MSASEEAARADAYFVADQREILVTDLKAGNWVYLADLCAWIQLARDVSTGHTVLRDSKGTASAVRLDFVGGANQFFRRHVKLWVRRTEEGD